MNENGIFAKMHVVLETRGMDLQRKTENILQICNTGRPIYCSGGITVKEKMCGIAQLRDTWD